jgi:hypothetical protein
LIQSDHNLYPVRRLSTNHVRLNLLINLFAILFAESEQVSQAFGHRALGVSRERRLARGGHGVHELFSRQKTLENRSFRPDPPLAKPCVSGVAPWFNQGFDPDHEHYGSSCLAYAQQ